MRMAISIFSILFQVFSILWNALGHWLWKRVHSTGNRKYYLKIKPQNQEDTKWYTNSSISQRDKNPWNIIERLYFTDSDEKCITFLCTLHVCVISIFIKIRLFSDRLRFMKYHRRRQERRRNNAHSEFFENYLNFLFSF